MLAVEGVKGVASFDLQIVQRGDGLTVLQIMRRYRLKMPMDASST